MKKYLASFICSALIIGTISISCNSIKADNVDEKQFDSLLYQYADDPFVAEEVDEMKKNAIEFRSQDYYIRQVTNDDKTTVDSNPLYGLDKYSGYIQSKGRFTNSSTSSGTLSFLYGHLQAGLSFSLSTSITKKGECSLSFSPNLSISYDQFQHQDEFVK